MVDNTNGQTTRQGGGQPELAYLLAVDSYQAPWPVEESLDELAQLAATAGARVVGHTFQRMQRPDPRTYLGRGKLAEVREDLDATGAEVVLVDDELSPSTQKAVEEALGRRVVDRTLLILDIFAQRARTHEGRVQVELARLEYLLPRLTRAWTHLERQGGGIGMRGGPGETQIEIDRRLIRGHISNLRGEIDGIRRDRSSRRVWRQRAGVPVVALVGYTNAGKSTLFNTLTAADTVAEDKLFATLDPLTRQIALPGGQEILVSDTVGFIAKLPTRLIAAFRATLEELEAADLLVHVVDITSAHAAERAELVQGVLRDLGVGERPMLTAMNKVDLLALSPEHLEETVVEARAANSVVVSARLGWNTRELQERIEAMLERGYERVRVRIPYAQAGLVELFHRKGTIATEKHTEDGTVITGSLPTRYAEWFRPYRLRTRRGAGRVAGSTV